jgi:hypothetical protein
MFSDCQMEDGGETYCIAKESEDGVANAGRVVQVQRVSDGSDKLFMRVFLWDFTTKDLWLAGQWPSSSQRGEGKVGKD